VEQARSERNIAVNATLAGISIQTIGLILFLVGVVWLVIEIAQ
jgi:hypothetical protein